MNRLKPGAITLALVGAGAGVAVTAAPTPHPGSRQQSESSAAALAFVSPSTHEDAARSHRQAGDELREVQAQQSAAAARKAALLAASARRKALARAATARASRSSLRHPVPHSPFATGDARSIARALLSGFGWSAEQFGCLDPLWTRESGWRVTAANASGAYGIPQALPGSKMATYGSDWRTNPRTQITWGLHYIAGRYGSPCSAWSHFQATGWY